MKPFKRAPVILTIFVLALICGARLLRLDFFERLERMTYDLRARAALYFPAPAATNLAFIPVGESSIIAVKSGKLGYRYGLYWPRQVYGRLVEELSTQGAKTIAFDVLFGELRRDHPPVQMADGGLIESDDFLALQMHRAGNVILAVEPGLVPPDLFMTNAFALGDISTEKDSDGVLRRVRAFRFVRRWHPLIENAAQKNGLSLNDIVIEKGRIILPLPDGQPLEIPLDGNGEMEIKSRKALTGQPMKARPFTDERVWHMCIVLAAQ